MGFCLQSAWLKIYIYILYEYLQLYILHRYRFYIIDLSFTGIVFSIKCEISMKMTILNMMDGFTNYYNIAVI